MMANDIKLVYYSSVKTKRVDWLWFPYIAYGRITMIQGDPGDGKTTLALMLVSMLSNGKNSYNVDGLKINKPYNYEKIFSIIKTNKCDLYLL